MLPLSFLQKANKGSKVIERLKKKLSEQESLLLLMSPNMAFRVHNRNGKVSSSTHFAQASCTGWWMWCKQACNFLFVMLFWVQRNWVGLSVVLHTNGWQQAQSSSLGTAANLDSLHCTNIIRSPCLISSPDICVCLVLPWQSGSAHVSSPGAPLASVPLQPPALALLLLNNLGESPVANGRGLCCCWWVT